MRKLLFALGFLLALSAPAKAGVPCSVPFNLTNGTVADASQVMANYNAILSCLSTSAAASGSNNDITALNALSTPITPAQGGAVGLCGANGFTAANNTGTPLTELDLKFTQAIVVNGLGALQQSITPTTLTLNFGTIGAANGLDAGALAASSNYYLYLIGNGSTVASLASLSSTTPLLPSGYTFSCRVGAWYSTTLSQLVTGRLGGNRFQVLQKSGGSGSNIAAGALQFTTVGAIGTCGTTTDTTVLTAFNGIPATAIEAVGNISSAGLSAVSSVGTSTHFSTEIVTTNSASVTVQFNLVMPAAQSIYLCSSSSAGSVFTILGWVDSVNAH